VRRTRNESIECEAEKEKDTPKFECNIKKDTHSRKRAPLDK